MPLDVDNGLPGIELWFGSSPANEISFICHVDKCVAMNTGKFTVHKWLMKKYPSNIKLSDKHSRWWPDWYRYSSDSITNDIIFGTRILFCPSMLPDSTKYIRWIDELLLAGSNIFLLDLFDFEHISATNRTCSKVSL